MSDKLREALNEKMKGLIPETVVMAQVTSVDKTALSITVKQSDNELELYDVRIMPAMESAANSLVCIPKVGSLCLVGLIHNIPASNYMIMCQECDEIIINGGSLGGLIKINELLAQMKKDTDILQALLSVVLGPTIQEPGSGAPSALQIVMKTKMQSLKVGNYSEIENKKVTHG